MVKGLKRRIPTPPGNVGTNFIFLYCVITLKTNHLLSKARREGLT